MIRLAAIGTIIFDCFELTMGLRLHLVGLEW
jgi:hypothetical protein